MTLKNLLQTLHHGGDVAFGSIHRTCQGFHLWCFIHATFIEDAEDFIRGGGGDIIINTPTGCCH